MHTEFCMHKHAHKSILQAQKPVHANIKFVEPWHALTELKKNKTSL